MINFFLCSHHKYVMVASKYDCGKLKSYVVAHVHITTVCLQVYVQLL